MAVERLTVLSRNIFDVQIKKKMPRRIRKLLPDLEPIL